MGNKPPPTQLSQIVTQAVQNIQARINFGALALKPGAKVPEIRVKNAQAGKPDVYQLLGDRYLLGRSSKSCDIVVRNSVVSQVHLSLNKDKQNPRHFIVKDENSTNGIYQGKRRLKSLALYHGDVISLGPSELRDGVEIEYYNPPPWLILFIRYFLYGTGGIIGLLVLGLGIAWSKITVTPMPKGVVGPVVIYARDGKTPLRPLSTSSHRELANLSDFSPYLPQAVIASEDTRYYWHLGVDPYGIARAIVINLKKDGISQGGSTITQQLARSLYTQVGRENTASRKLREMIVALKLEAFYSKDEILKTYLNRVYLGVGSYGFEDAARFYFDKSAADVNISEAATLVAMLPAPNIYNPVNNYDISVKLRNRVINRMVGLGMITEAEANRARRSRIEVSPRAQQTISNTIAPYFYNYVFTELSFLLGEELAKEGNFIVETSLDLNTQKKSEAALKDAVRNQGSRYNFSQGAIVTLNTAKGEILALTGGVDYGQSQFNRATQAQRQPGSTFKIFAYAAAIEEGISPRKVYSCAPLTWQGQTYKACERSGGSADMYRGIAQSENAIALRVAKDVGLRHVVAMAQRLGIKSKLNPVPGLVLGQSEVNVLEITGAYGALANQGIWNRPHAITKILDSSDCRDYSKPQTCRVIYAFDRDQNRRKRAISPRLASIMTSLLRRVVRSGTGRRASLRLGEAGKTGTTNRGVDLWFVGYLPSRKLVTGVWLGNDDNSPTSGSSAQAATLWGNYMKKILKK